MPCHYCSRNVENDLSYWILDRGYVCNECFGNLERDNSFFIWSAAYNALVSKSRFLKRARQIVTGV